MLSMSIYFLCTYEKTNSIMYICSAPHRSFCIKYIFVHSCGKKIDHAEGWERLYGS